MYLPCSEVKLLHKVVHGHLQPVQAVLDLQINLRVLEMVPKDSPIPIPKNLGFKKIKFLAFPEAKLLHEDVLDLLQPVQAVLDLQVNLSDLKMISNDFPYQRILGLKKPQVSSMLRSEVTPRSCP